MKIQREVLENCIRYTNMRIKRVLNGDSIEDINTVFTMMEGMYTIKTRYNADDNILKIFIEFTDYNYKTYLKIKFIGNIDEPLEEYRCQKLITGLHKSKNKITKVTINLNIEEKEGLKSCKILSVSKLCDFLEEKGIDIV